MRSFDQMRLGAAVGFPGIDPRTWIAFAIVRAIKIDSAGAKADVAVWPTGEEETVAIGGPIGAGYGCYIPVELGQLVVVSFNIGDSGHGGSIIGSVWDRGAPPPAVVIANPNDVAVAGRTNRALRVLSQGSGKLVLATEGGDVLLGTEGATAGVARIGDSVEVTIPPGTVIIANPLFPGPGQPEFIPNPIPITLSGVITSGSERVKSS